jgi:hypothetical protein
MFFANGRCPRLQGAPRSAVLLVVIVALLFSGCAAERTDSGLPSTTIAGPVTPTFTDDTGAILVMVIDAELRPVVGAVVMLNESGENAFTSSDGRAAISKIVPGAWTLVVSADGFHTYTKQIEVAVAAVTNVRVTVLPTTTQLPYHVIVPFVGLWYCTIGAGGTYVGSCEAATTNLNGDRRTFSFDVQGAWSTMVYEATTTPTSTFGARGFGFGLWGTVDNESKCYGNHKMPSPARTVWNVGQKIQPCGGDDLELPPGPSHFYVGMNPWNGEQASDVVIAWEQRFNVWLAIFYHGEAPAGFSSLPDQ